MKANHRHESCRDSNCELPYCRIWKEALAEGYEAGYADGFQNGFAAGAKSAGSD